jgi:hypothetical protein
MFYIINIINLSKQNLNNITIDILKNLMIIPILYL